MRRQVDVRCARRSAPPNAIWLARLRSPDTSTEVSAGTCGPRPWQPLPLSLRYRTPGSLESPASHSRADARRGHRFDLAIRLLPSARERVRSAAEEPQAALPRGWVKGPGRTDAILRPPPTPLPAPA